MAATEQGSDEALAQRWGFLSPWCEALRGRIKFGDGADKAGVWETFKFGLQFTLPQASSFDNLELFQIALQKTREALALLVAVERVDHNAWKFIAEKWCGLGRIMMKEGEQRFEEKIPVKFLLVLDLEGRQIPDGVDYDLVRFCGINQREACTPEYLDALKQIAEHYRSLKPGKPGVDIQIPVRVYIKMAKYEDSLKPMRDAYKAQEVVKGEWNAYRESVEDDEVSPGSLRCTFVLEPLVANCVDISFVSDEAEEMEALEIEGNWFSQIQNLELGGFGGLRDDDVESKRVIGRLTRLLFRGSERAASSCDSQSSRGVDLWLDRGLLLLFESLCSSLCSAQSIRTLMLSLFVDRDDQRRSSHWWKWLAYGLFSNRARSRPSFENITLTSLQTMSAEDMEGFCAVLAAAHPEEYLCGTPRGQVDERTATLGRNGAVRWHVDGRGQPVIDPPILRVPWTVHSVRTFSDDGSSEWVNAIVPDFGRCQVRREDLKFVDEDSGDGACTSGLISLIIEFNEDEIAVSDGLPRFIEAVGPLLQSLTIAHATIALDVNEIIRSCPSLQTLVLCGELIDMQIDLSGYRASNLPVPTLNCQSWENSRRLVRELSAMDNALTNCVQRLRVRLKGITGEDGGGGVIRSYMIALQELLARNARLEFVDVVVKRGSEHYMDSIRKFHLKPTNRSLKVPSELKAAFLSALIAGKPATPSHKKASHESVSTATALAKLDQLVLVNVLEFAAPPVLRQVYFCSVHHWM